MAACSHPPRSWRERRPAPRSPWSPSDATYDRLGCVLGEEGKVALASLCLGVASGNFISTVKFFDVGQCISKVCSTRSRCGGQRRNQKNEVFDPIIEIDHETQNCGCEPHDINPGIAHVKTRESRRGQNPHVARGLVVDTKGVSFRRWCRKLALDGRRCSWPSASAPEHGS